MDALQRSERARKAGRARWRGVSPEQRTEHMRRIAAERQSTPTLVRLVAARAAEFTPEDRATLRRALRQAQR